MIIIRITALLIGTTILLTYTTSPIMLTDGLEQLLSPLRKIGLPVHEFSMMMTIALRFIPTLIEETDKIISAQKARGADFASGSLAKRAKTLVPILIPLFISNFPGCTEEEMKVVDDFLEAHHWSPQQVQDYIPLPMTMGAAMYYSGKNPYTGEEIEVHRGLRDRRTQIQMLKKKRASRYRQPDWKDKRDRKK